jgi:hypothetical protein
VFLLDCLGRLSRFHPRIARRLGLGRSATYQEIQRRLMSTLVIGVRIITGFTGGEFDSRPAILTHALLERSDTES